jgi:uncharacterized protein
MKGQVSKKVIYLTMLIILLLPFVAACQPSQAQPLAFSIATGGTGGVWYPLGGAISGLITQNVENTEATSEATTAAIDNLKLLVTDQAGMAFCYDYHVIWANEGKMPDVSADAQPVRMMMGFYEQPLHIVTTAATGITSIEDLRGKRVSTGAPASGTEEQAIYVLSALGIDWENDITSEKLGATESVAALKDGKIDAFFWSGAIPTSSIIDLASTAGLTMVLLPIDGATAETIMQANPGVFHQTTFPAGTYTGVDSDVPAIAITAVLTVMEDFPEEKLYEILGVIFDHKADLAAVWSGATNMTAETAVNQVTPGALDYLHAGAERYFQEQGALP